MKIVLNQSESSMFIQEPSNLEVFLYGTSSCNPRKSYVSYKKKVKIDNHVQTEQLNTVSKEYFVQEAL